MNSDPSEAAIRLQRQWAESVSAKEEAERLTRRLAKGTPIRLWPLLDSGELLVTEAMSAVTTFRDDQSSFLVLAGGLGTGKTVAGAWLCDSHAGPALFLDSTEIARAPWYNNPGQGQWESVDVLTIDDLGVEYVDAKGWFLMVLDGVMNARYNRGVKTIITTNLTLERFKGRYRERMMDRIHEAGRFVELKGPNLRRNRRDSARSTSRAGREDKAGCTTPACVVVWHGSRRPPS
jgi:hypothetical protein